MVSMKWQRSRVCLLRAIFIPILLAFPAPSVTSVTLESWDSANNPMFSPRLRAVEEPLGTAMIHSLVFISSASGLMNCKHLNLNKISSQNEFLGVESTIGLPCYSTSGNKLTLFQVLCGISSVTNPELNKTFPLCPMTVVWPWRVCLTYVNKQRRLFRH